MINLWKLFFKANLTVSHWIGCFLISWLLAACATSAPQTASQDVSALSTQAVATVYANLTLSPTFPTTTPTPPPPSPTSLPSAITDKFGVPMMLVPAGPFLMGRDKTADNQPSLEVTVGDYYIDKYEVTNASYRACVEARVCEPPYHEGSYTHGSYYLNPDFANYPVLSHPRSPETYCKWRRAHLVTEIEWEKAMVGTDGRAYPWGNDRPAGTRANLCDSNCYQKDQWSMNDGFTDVAPVGNFPAGASPYGVMDLVGNVNERVTEADELGKYREVIGRARELVGGAYDTGPSETFYAWFDTGFRCAKGLDGEPINVTVKLIGPTLTPTVTPANTPRPGDASAPREADGMFMVYVPGGTFEMGLESGLSDESQVHTVSLNAFWMDEHEVTNAMFKMCVDAAICYLPYDLSEYFGNPDYPVIHVDSYYNSNPNFPVIYLDWNMANAYCKWAGGRLPTEAEWEYAARGGLEGKTYPWGDEAPVCTPGAENGAQYNSCSINSPIAVKTFQPNGYGLYDMAGNGREWLSDWYGAYPSGALENPTGPENGRERVVRGGSWRFSNDSGDDLRVSKRDIENPAFTNNNLGFRCLRSP